MGSITSPPRLESEPADPAPLGQPLEFPNSKRVAINRFLKASMSEKLATFDEHDLSARGIPGKELENLYRKWGEGQWGVILTGNVMIDPGHLEGAHNTIIPIDALFEGERFEGYKAMAAAAKSHGSLLVAQVGHPGRQTPESLQKHPISASDIQLVTAALAPGFTYGKPRSATQDDIDSIIKAFTHAAVYPEKAGVDGIELHGAHGYLLAQFISQYTNHRTDKYGGSLENRINLILEIAASIKAKVSEKFILGIKINSVEFQDQGFTQEEAVVLCRALEDAGFGFVETSGGTYESIGDVMTHTKESTRRREAYFLEFSGHVHRAASTLRVYTTGGFKTAAAMVRALEEIDGVGIGASSAQEPDLPLAILSGRAPSVWASAADMIGPGARLVAAYSQMRQISNEEDIVDLSNADNVQKILAAAGMA
jgi:2,4-dienoyl-CoA reductase-like NADH-dependent reductase (Old Yellow Enzyme family)